MVVRSLAGEHALVHCTLGIYGSLISGSLFVSCEKSVGNISPDVTEPLAYIMLAKELALVLKLGDMSVW